MNTLVKRFNEIKSINFSEKFKTALKEFLFTLFKNEIEEVEEELKRLSCAVDSLKETINDVDHDMESRIEDEVEDQLRGLDFDDQISEYTREMRDQISDLEDDVSDFKGKFRALKQALAE